MSMASYVKSTILILILFVLASSTIYLGSLENYADQEIPEYLNEVFKKANDLRLNDIHINGDGSPASTIYGDDKVKSGQARLDAIEKNKELLIWFNDQLNNSITVFSKYLKLENI